MFFLRHAWGISKIQLFKHGLLDIFRFLCRLCWISWICILIHWHSQLIPDPEPKLFWSRNWNCNCQKSLRFPNTGYKRLWLCELCVCRCCLFRAPTPTWLALCWTQTTTSPTGGSAFMYTIENLRRPLDRFSFVLSSSRPDGFGRILAQRLLYILSNNSTPAFPPLVSSADAFKKSDNMIWPSPCWYLLRGLTFVHAVYKSCAGNLSVQVEILT
jgi:hypothetical protein